MGKSILAVVAGLLFIIIVSTLVDLPLHAAGVFPPAGQPLTDAQCAIALSYRIVIGIIGGWLTARLAPRNPMKHAMILGAIGVVLSAVGVIVASKMNLGPLWYPILLVVLAIPQSWAGAALYKMQTRGA